ncbi:MAG: B3/B4 domain-containing protein [Gammaproteobacteria bacterium]
MTKALQVMLDKQLAEAGISVVFLLATGSLVDSSPEETAAQWQDTQQTVRQEHNLKSLLTHPHLRGYRELHRHFDVPDSLLTPSPESLLRILFERGSLNSLGTLVDIYNSISLMHLISIGGHDADKLGEHLSLGRNHDSVRFRPLGQKKKITLPANEYSYRTAEDRAICRLECRQANDTKIRPESTTWLFILQGNRRVPDSGLFSASEDLINALRKRCTDFDSDKCLLCPDKLTSRLVVSPV